MASQGVNPNLRRTIRQWLVVQAVFANVYLAVSIMGLMSHTVDYGEGLKRMVAMADAGMHGRTGNAMLAYGYDVAFVILPRLILLVTGVVVWLRTWKPADPFYGRRAQWQTRYLVISGGISGCCFAWEMLFWGLMSGRI